MTPHEVLADRTPVPYEMKHHMVDRYCQLLASYIRKYCDDPSNLDKWTALIALTPALLATPKRGGSNHSNHLSWKQRTRMANDGRVFELWHRTRNADKRKANEQ